MMTSKNGKMQPTPLLPLLDGGRCELWILSGAGVLGVVRSATLTGFEPVLPP